RGDEQPDSFLRRLQLSVFALTGWRRRRQYQRVARELLFDGRFAPMASRSDNGISRRRFLQAGAATSLGLAGLPALLHAQSNKADPFSPFIMGAQSYCFRNFDRETALKRTQELGLHFIEFFQQHAPLTSSPEQIKAILALCGNYDIKPIAFGVQSFNSNHDANKKIFDFGKALGIKTFSADPSPDSFDSLDKLVDEYKISIAIHPHGPAG